MSLHQLVLKNQQHWFLSRITFLIFTIRIMWWWLYNYEVQILVLLLVGFPLPCCNNFSSSMNMISSSNHFELKQLWQFDQSNNHIFLPVQNDLRSLILQWTPFLNKNFTVHYSTVHLFNNLFNTCTRNIKNNKMFVENHKRLIFQVFLVYIQL